MSKVNGSRYKVYIMDGSPTPVKKLISEQLSLTESRTTNTIDVTSKDNDGYEEFIRGLRSGEWSFETIMDADLSTTDASKVNYMFMSNLDSAGVVRQYRIELISDSQTLYTIISGLITKFDKSAPMEDKITVSFTIKRSGKPVDNQVANA